MDLRWPASRAEIAVIQSERKRIAFERARKAPFYRGRLDGIDPNRLDDPEIWASIPLLSKEDLRTIAPRIFRKAFASNRRPKWSNIGDRAGQPGDLCSILARLRT